ncbi:MAG: hypothetical protein LKM32_02700 [Chiayiivirga sp.]|jgi:hypothetical protein|uniref:hypothetical protein n=1 Tax=Chiayiivirga sp. TaxID=2041042 RepID=UPI0025BC60E7|nr:hypothetical protein [Chiayiivirga sp.]MCI1710815.1 hypothetical protein [Chiayiivirga sp.]MCI1728345.1 hypothetical protein [Chiayiivirga sp.]
MIAFFVYLLLFLAGVAVYLLARSSRRRSTCASCGEVVRMEHDRVRHCPSCGALLP